LAKIDVDQAEALPDRFQITAVPTVLAIKDGTVVNQFRGVIQDEELDDFIDDLLEK
jgi:thioredoxin 1